MPPKRVRWSATFKRQSSAMLTKRRKAAPESRSLAAAYSSSVRGTEDVDMGPRPFCLHYGPSTASCQYRATSNITPIVEQACLAAPWLEARNIFDGHQMAFSGDLMAGMARIERSARVKIASLQQRGPSEFEGLTRKCSMEVTSSIFKGR